MPTLRPSAPTGSVNTNTRTQLDSQMRLMIIPGGRSPETDRLFAAETMLAEAESSWLKRPSASTAAEHLRALEALVELLVEFDLQELSGVTPGIWAEVCADLRDAWPAYRGGVR